MGSTGSNNKIVSILITIGAAQFLFMMHLAEFLFPSYNVSNNYISDLGAMCRGGVCTIYQPSSLIFNSSIIVLGIMIMISSYYIHRLFRSLVLSGVVFLAGIGSVGVGAFPETYGVLHTISSIVTFVPASLIPLTTSFVIRDSFFRAFSVVMSILSILSLALFVSRNDLGLGIGGIERLIVYPILFWALFFGGFILKYR
ncbi:MAG: DUF998 domain-containing protein [Sulfolobales archaeon]